MQSAVLLPLLLLSTLAGPALLLIDRDTGLPVEAAIIAFDSGSEFETNANGFVQLTGVTPGRYLLHIDSPGFIDLVPSRTLRIAGAEQSPIIIPVVRGAAVSGQVADSDGHPISGMGVFALAGGRPVRVDTPAVTDDEGRYRLHSLPPGVYTIAATGKGHGTIYNATTIEVGPGANVTSIHLRAPPHQPATLSGTISAIPTQWPVRRAAVAITPQSGLQLPIAYTTTTEEGVFRLDGLPPGDYHAIAWGPLSPTGAENPPEGPEVRYASVPVSVQTGSPIELNLSLSPATRLQVSWEGAPCDGADSLTVRPESAWPEHWIYPRRNLTNAAVWANLPSGPYRFEMPHLDPACTFVGVRDSKALIVRSAGGISGSLRSKGAPVKAAAILLWSDGPRHISAQTTTDESGAFQFTQLPRGHYQITLASKPQRRWQAAIDAEGLITLNIELEEEK